MYLYYDQFVIGILNQKIISPFFSATIGGMVTKSYKVSINAFMFISSKIIESVIKGAYAFSLDVMRKKEMVAQAEFYRFVPYCMIILILCASFFVLRYK